MNCTMLLGKFLTYNVLIIKKNPRKGKTIGGQPEMRFTANIIFKKMLKKCSEIIKLEKWQIITIEKHQKGQKKSF